MTDCMTDIILYNTTTIRVLKLQIISVSEQLGHSLD